MFKGSICALITPFKDGRVDDEALVKLVEWHIREGTHGLVPCGTTGESPTLSHEEHHHVVELCIEAAAGRIPIMAGTGSNSTAEAVSLTQHAKSAGADAVLVVAPYYNKPNAEGIYQHYKAINDCADIPIYVYNIPGRSVVDISVEVMARLAELPNVVGVKDATADLTRPLLHRQICGRDFIQLSGEDPTAVAFMANGGHGCISVTANVAPAQCAALQNACLRGDFTQALEIQDMLMPLHTALFADTSPAPVKFAAATLGLCQDELRLPLVSVGEAVRKRVREAMLASGIL